MKTIYKYQLQPTEHQVIRVPELMVNNITVGFKDQILTLDTQYGAPCLWIAVDTSCPKFERNIVIKGTGHNCEDVDFTDYIGTYQECSGNLIWHVFGN